MDPALKIPSELYPTSPARVPLTCKHKVLDMMRIHHSRVIISPVSKIIKWRNQRTSFRTRHYHSDFIFLVISLKHEIFSRFIIETIRETLGHFY